MKVSHLNALRALEAVLRLGSFRAAADEIGVTTAAIGQQIRSLEDVVGQKLFERHATGARPIPLLLKSAPKLNGAFRDLSDVLHDLNARNAPKRVAVTMTVAIAESWLPAQLPSFFREVQDVDLRLEASRDMVDLRDQVFDFAIRHIGDHDHDFDSITLFPSFVAPVCTPGFADRYPLGPDIRSLAGVPLAHNSIETSDPDWANWPEWCARFDVDLPKNVGKQSVSGGAGGLTLVSTGVAMGLSALIDSFAALQKGDLVAPFGKQKIVRTAYSYKLLWMRGRRLTPIQKQFRDWIADRAAQQRAELAAWLDAADR